MAFADADFINGDARNIFKPGTFIFSGQITLLDILDDVPADAQMLSDI